VTANRQDSFASVTEAETAGFTAAAEPEIHAWITAAFSQEPTVEEVVILRRDATDLSTCTQVLQVDITGPTYVDETADAASAGAADFLPFPAVEAIGDYVAFCFGSRYGRLVVDNAGGTAGTVGVGTWKYWNGLAYVDLSGVSDATVGFTAAALDGRIVSWTMPTDWNTNTVEGVTGFRVIFEITTVYTINPVLDQVFVGYGVAATLAACQAADTDGWFITNAEWSTDDEILEAASWHESLTTDDGKKMYCARSEDTDAFAGSAASIIAKLKALNYSNTFTIINDDDTIYHDAAWSARCGAFKLDEINGAGDWAGKPLVGVAATEVTSSQFANIIADNGNVYAAIRGTSLTFDGKTASGRWIDIQTTNHWLVRRFEEDIVEARAGVTTKIPGDETGMAFFDEIAEKRCGIGVTNKHLSSYRVRVPKYTELTQQQKLDRRVPITLHVVYSNALGAATVVINTSF
jgi:hypothetical protein